MCEEQHMSISSQLSWVKLTVLPVKGKAMILIILIL